MEKTNKQESIVICDAGSIIHLDELSCIDLLYNFKQVIIPESVKDEVNQHRPEALKNSAFDYTVFSRRELSPRIKVATTLFTLHEGEIDALAILQDYPNAIFLTDDGAARLAALHLQLKVHGTIGLIIRAIRCKQRTHKEVLRILQSIPEQTTLYIRQSFLDEIIIRVNDSATF